MKVLSIYKPAKNVPVTPEDIAKMSVFAEEMKKAGVLLATEGRKENALEMRFQLAKGELRITDGPFTESKELIAGFAVLQVKSREQLIDVTRRFLEIAGDGECEIIEVFAPGEFHG
jgi:hypothetical protein